MDVLTSGVSALQALSALVALGGWALGMYYWWVANFAPLPKDLDASKFAERGPVARRRAIISFVVMLIAGLLAWGLRMLLETNAAA